MRHLLSIAALSLLAACQQDEAAQSDVVDLPARDQLIRLSMDLRGVHPTEPELWQFENVDPIARDGLYDSYAAEWIEDPRFIGRMKEIFNQRLLFRTGDVYFDQRDMDGLSNVDDRVMAETIANEPLNLLQYIVENDLPYSEMVTADYTMSNEILGKYWGIDYPSDAGGAWVPSHYQDGRPHAGLLTMSTTWQRYPSMGGNANRHRANAVSKLFLCDDYLSRPIVLNRAAVDQLTIDPENAINQNTGCQSCHASLDPIAANFFGFFNYDAEDGIESTRYRPENEEEWRYYSGKEPAYYGRPTGNVPEFAQALADDSRFTDCAVRTMWEGLTQRDYVDEDWPEVAPHADLFVDTDMNVKEAFLSIVTSDSYKAGAARDPELAERLAGQKVVSPEQLSALIKDTTGYTWYFDGRDGLKDLDLGLPVLAGGIDSKFVTRRAYIPTVGLAYVQERLSTSAAYYVAEHDLDPERTEDAKLLLYVTVQDTPESNPEAFEEQIRFLYLRITGHPLAEDATEPQELMDTWKYLYSVEASPTTAWAGVLSAVLRDPQVLFY
ncbi:MAG: hypothetical protein KC621_21520 [Myxococcales bacterium]|nr:hypothetical protein [Myxococcales bacterium]